MTIQSRHREMLSDFSDAIDLVFESRKKGSSLELEIIETQLTGKEIQNFLKLKRSKKSGKNETKYKLILQVDRSMMEKYSISVIQYSKEKKQVLVQLLVYKNNKGEATQNMFFIGRGSLTSPLLFMIDLPQKLHGLPLSKITEKIFCPFSEKTCSLMESRNLDFIMLNPETYLIEEPSLQLKNVCEEAISKLKDKSANAPEVVYHQKEIFLKKDFGFGLGQFYEKGVSPNDDNNMNNDYTFPDGCSFLNGKYKIPDRYRYLRLMFEECVELNLPYVRQVHSKAGHFKSYIYVRGDVREIEDSKTGQTAASIGVKRLTTWKRLFILREQRGWIDCFKF
ncbi:hypothetical protein FDP41_008369 [Naegleria fowleri]|uniref:Uncharacterized protein n=1 Tax=Naegleria fowleri TaxID=5763 RepID=A0A6A5BEA3_NAEFO|nr:uncharacterized protein FDP41_008369 [Naegleria fowleri]KAF0973162.1 hypothetical protein FDP41_008369 [Naegleria fowleri]CAG4714454.1 unnamed protein product [Naegleria fowleri]